MRRPLKTILLVFGAYLAISVLYGIKSALGINLTPWRFDDVFPLGHWMQMTFRPLKR